MLSAYVKGEAAWRSRSGRKAVRKSYAQSLTEDASKCVKITNMFAAAASASSVDEDSSSGRQGEQQTDMQACDSATEGQTERESVIRKQVVTLE